MRVKNEIIGGSFENETIVIDETHYERCTFNGCRMIYRGGPALLSSCKIDSNCQVELQDAAAVVLRTLIDLGWRVDPPGPTRGRSRTL